MSDPIKRVYEFGPFRLDPAEGQLWRNSDELPLTQKTLGLLTMLVENNGHVVDKNELMEKVWPDAIVEENRVADIVSTLRKVLGDDPKSPHFIKTVPGRGYRFVAEVHELDEPDGDVLIVESTRSRVVVEEDQELHETPRDSPTNLIRERDGLARSLLPGQLDHRFRRLLIAAATVLLAVFAVSYYFLKKDKQPTSQTTWAKSIAILPFKPLVASVCLFELRLVMQVFHA